MSLLPSFMCLDLSHFSFQFEGLLSTCKSLPTRTHIAFWLSIASIVLHGVSRCPIICFACSGDFYHELNIGLPSQGKCVHGDVMMSITSLSLGILSVAMALLMRVWRDLQSCPRIRLLWLVPFVIILWRFALAFALTAGVSPAVFDGYIANCAATGHPPNKQSFAVLSSSSGMDVGPDMGQCLDLQQKGYVEKHGYELIRPGDCRKMFAAHEDILPALPASIASNLARDGFHNYCKEAHILVTLHTRPDLDWVLWLDYDAVITSFDRKLEDFVPATPVDFILTVGSEDSTDFQLSPGHWHSMFPQVPSWSTTAGRFNAGVFMVRNTPAAKATLAKTLTLDFGSDDQAAIGTAIFSKATANATPISVNGDVVSVDSLAVRALAPRCMDAHPMNWAPWGRWLPGDFISHNWGANKIHFTMDACIKSSQADWRTEALVQWNTRKGFFAGLLCASMLWLTGQYLSQVWQMLRHHIVKGEKEPLLKASLAEAGKAGSRSVNLPTVSEDINWNEVCEWL